MKTSLFSLVLCLMIVCVHPGVAQEDTRYRRYRILSPAIQYHLFFMSTDYFPQFAFGGDHIFADYIGQAFVLEEGSFSDGEGVVYVSKTGADGKQARSERTRRFEKALLQTTAGGNKWWRVVHSTRPEGLYPSEGLYYEVLVSREGIPLLIRYGDPKTGEDVEVELNDPEALKEELSQLSREQIARAINQRRDEIFLSVWNMFFENPEVQGEETVETSAGRFKAFRVRDVLTRMGNVEVDYWISPAVPGNLVKIRYRSRQNGAESSVELSQITKNNVSLIDEDALVRRSPGQAATEAVSEGSPDDPVELTIGSPHYGSVGHGETSYYHLRASKRGDIFVEVTELKGSADLVYYGADSTYRDWLVSSEGNSPNVESYFVEAGTDLYFSVADIEDEFSVGESYTIDIRQNYILDTTGILIKGEIYDRAVELESGGSHSLTLGAEGLAYYKTTVRRRSNLKILAEGLSPFADLIWFDAQNGSYSEASGERFENGIEWTIRNVTAGTVCYYYISGDPEAVDPNSVFTLTVQESGQ